MIGFLDDETHSVSLPRDSLGLGNDAYKNFTYEKFESYRF